MSANRKKKTADSAKIMMSQIRAQIGQLFRCAIITQLFVRIK